MSRRVFRTPIPVDDQWHTVDMRGRIVHVATRGEDYVEVWYIDDPWQLVEPRTFRVFGTGQPLDEDAGEHVGSAVTPNDGRYVWHLFERRTP